MIIFGEHGLRTAIREYADHYHGERNHQGLGNRLILHGNLSIGLGRVQRKLRLGGLLNYYYRAA
jgi:hypothetical protein